LVEAFKATLEELKYADVLLHVIDSSSPERDTQIDVVRRLIADLDASETPCIEVYNKADMCPYPGEIPWGDDIVTISAKTGEGVDRLLEKIAEVLGRGKKNVVLHIPYEKAGLCDLLHREAEVTEIEYKDSFIEVRATVRPEIWGQIREFEYLGD
jgi:GTP-binding protein HflX